MVSASISSGRLLVPEMDKFPTLFSTQSSINEIHLALKRSQQLVHWMPDTEIRSRNELTECGYRKDYDAVVTVRVAGGERKFALEYERTPKARRQYVQICADIAAERAVDRFLYLAPNYDLLSFLVGCFTTLRRPIYFGLARDFIDKLFDMPLRGARPGAMMTLRRCASVGQTFGKTMVPATDCNVIAVRLPAIAVFEPIVSPSA